MNAVCSTRDLSLEAEPVSGTLSEQSGSHLNQDRISPFVAAIEILNKLFNFITFMVPGGGVEPP